MDKIQYFIYQREQDDKLREKITSSYLQAMMENIRGMRGLVVNFITISSAIIGFSIPVLSGNKLVKNEWFLICGLLVLLVVIIYGFYYLRSILQKENKDLVELNDRFNDVLTKQVDARNKFFLKQKTTNRDFEAWQTASKQALKDLDVDESKKNIQLDYSLDILFVGFFIALGLIVLSLIDVSRAVETLSIITN